MRKFFSNLFNISEDKAKWLGRIFGVIILLLLYGFGFFWGKPDSDPFNVGNAYEALHPLKIHDLIGVIIFTGGVAWLTGIIELFIGDIGVPEGSVWPNYVGVAAGILGFILMWV